MNKKYIELVPEFKLLCCNGMDIPENPDYFDGQLTVEFNCFMAGEAIGREAAGKEIKYLKDFQKKFLEESGKLNTELETKLRLAEFERVPVELFNEKEQQLLDCEVALSFYAGCFNVSEGAKPRSALFEDFGYRANEYFKKKELK